MCSVNPLWGARRILGELLKVGIEVSQATVAKYMGRRIGTRAIAADGAARPRPDNESGLDDCRGLRGLVGG